VHAARKPKAKRPKQPPRFIVAEWGDRYVELPIFTKSEANMRGRWQGGARRAAKQREDLELAMRVVRVKPPLPVIVRLIRIAPSKLDENDNLNRALKALRDEFAAWLGVDDRRSDRVLFVYDQVRRAPRTYGIRIEWWTVTQQQIDDRRALMGARAR
jgi:hypothetical protein